MDYYRKKNDPYDRALTTAATYVVKQALAATKEAQQEQRAKKIEEENEFNNYNNNYINNYAFNIL